jgi:serine/threonine protein kinase
LRCTEILERSSLVTSRGSREWGKQNIQLILFKHLWVEYNYLLKNLVSYCLNFYCQFPQNPEQNLFCNSCGSKLLLKERYRPLKLLGEGGFGRTFAASDRENSLNPECVIKQLLTIEKNQAVLNKVIELFHQEAERLKELGEHPQIPDFFAHFSDNKQLYLVQELIIGSTLEEELKAQTCFTEEQIRDLLTKILPVLDFIHKKQVIHRDIKPANIMRREADGELFLIDFGVAKVIPPTALMKTGTIVGTPEYVAPEQLQGKAIPSSDLYSLGVTCIYLMTGVSPFQLFDSNDHRWVWQDYLPPQSKVGDRLINILNRLLQPAVKYRYESAELVLAALNYSSPKYSSAITKPANVIKSGKVKPKQGIKLEEVALDLFKKHFFNSPTTEIISSQGIDYTKLKTLLAAHKWQKADEETHLVMGAAANKSLGRFLLIGDLEKLPLEDLEIIDRLWLKYSQNRFGFSIQSGIYREVDRDYPSFCDRVGWPVHNPQSLYSVMHFHLQAPRGHLPSRSWVGGSQWWSHAEVMSVRLLGS